MKLSFNGEQLDDDNVKLSPTHKIKKEVVRSFSTISVSIPQKYIQTQRTMKFPTLANTTSIAACSILALGQCAILIVYIVWSS